MKFAYLIEPPFNYVDDIFGVTGCDVEVARYVLAELGVPDITLVETEFADLLPGLADGRWDMTTGLFGTDERRQSALFSRPIWGLPDGLLVAKGNPLGLSGYRSVAERQGVRLAVIRDQFQHRSAVAFGVEAHQIAIFHTYPEAATAVQSGEVDAYASVGMAHAGFIGQNEGLPLDLVLVPSTEKPPAFGSFAFGLDNSALAAKVDAVLADYLGSEAHRKMVATFGFSDREVDLVAGFETQRHPPP